MKTSWYDNPFFITNYFTGYDIDTSNNNDGLPMYVNSSLSDMTILENVNLFEEHYQRINATGIISNNLHLVEALPHPTTYDLELIILK